MLVLANEQGLSEGNGSVIMLFHHWLLWWSEKVFFAGFFTTMGTLTLHTPLDDIILSFQNLLSIHVEYLKLFSNDSCLNIFGYVNLTQNGISNPIGLTFF